MNGLEEEHERRVSVADRMQPLRGTIFTSATAEAARRRLEQEGLRFLVVVAPGTGMLVGAVDREALAAGPCCLRPGGRCTVVQHLALDVAFCWHYESAREVAETEAELAADAKVPAARRIPLIVVDDRLRPLGCFPVVSTGLTLTGTAPAVSGPSRAASDAPPAATPRAA